MKYISTRNKNNIVESAYAIKTGIAADGGLFVPQEIPSVSVADLKGGCYRDTAKTILKLFLTDFTAEQIEACVDAAYGKNFTVSDMIETVRLEDGVYITELFHGPTCAFKDMALQLMPHLLSTALEITNEKKTVVILTATSGDTGKAALDGFSDVPGVKIAVFFPVDGVSNIQKLQMTTQKGENVYVCAIHGNFDNAQAGVKKIFGDKAFAAQLEQEGVMLSSANSINIARLLPQIVYYFHSYATLLRDGVIQDGEKINFAVPTGNFGNILAAYYAKQMGLPVHKLICASNQNNVLTDFIRTGVYNARREFYTTSSPSMDILVSSNLERLLFELSDRDDALVAQLMQQLNSEGHYAVPAAMQEKLSELFLSGCCDNEATAKRIQDVYTRDHYVADPHTAVGIDVCLDAEREGYQTVVMSTASPFKFCESVLSACDVPYEGSDAFGSLDALSEHFSIPVPAGLSALKTAQSRFRDVISKEEMQEAVASFIRK